MAETVDLSDALRGDYARPRCTICGRLAGRASDGGWRFECVWFDGETWEHR